MTGLAISGVLVMLAVYTAFFVVALPHVADRYAPSLMPVILRRIAFWPLIALGTLSVWTAVLALLPTNRAWDILSLILLLTAVGIGLVASYRMWVQVANGPQLVNWLREQRDVSTRLALEEILWNAIQRADQPTTIAALKLALVLQDIERERLLYWLIDHRDLLATDWLTRELLILLLEDALNGGAAEQRAELLQVLLIDALDDEVFRRVRWIMEGIMKSLAEATPWTQLHAHLLYETGFSLWHVGESGESFPRTTQVSGQLERVQAIFLSRIRAVWRHVLHLGDEQAVEWYLSYLGRLAEDAPNDFILTRIYDVMEEGYSKHALTTQAVHELAASLGHARLLRHGDELSQQHIDSLVVTLAAMLVELGEKDADVHRLLGNGGVVARRPKRIIQQGWLQPASYAAVARCLGLNRF